MGWSKLFEEAMVAVRELIAEIRELRRELAAQRERV